jgi:type II secretory pathway component PulJ
MLSAFQLENNRLTRLEADEIKHLASSVWVDLVEPDDDERSRVQRNWVRTWRRARNWKTSKHPRVF